MSTHTTTGPGAGDRAYTTDDVQLRVADTIGAYKRQHYHAMHTHCLGLIAIARRLGASKDTDARDVENVYDAGERIVDAYETGDGDAMAADALGLLEIATSYTGGDA